MSFELFCGDSLEVLGGMGDCGVDAVVTDPPYGLSFMGKGWDRGIPPMPYWAEFLRVSKPGAHLLAFGGTRTYHRLMCSIEDAGWEIRDCLMWVYGSGFPKSHDVSKAIDREMGAERDVVGFDMSRYRKDNANNNAYAAHCGQTGVVTAPSSPAAIQWSGWGTALKPAWEPIVLARKPLDGTVAQNVMKWGVGGINVDGCRVGHDEPSRKTERNNKMWLGRIENTSDIASAHPSGRWPANLIHDGSWDVLGLFPETGAARKNKQDDERIHENLNAEIYGRKMGGRHKPENSHNDNGGSAARFFYCAKASKSDRDEGCEGLEEKACGLMEDDNYAWPDGRDVKRRNSHPTVKPTALMRYLCRLITPPNGLILDPFMGSGSTGKAAMLEGFRFIGIDKESEYVEIARRRIGAVSSR